MKGVLFGIIWIAGACWFVLFSTGNPLDELALIRRAQIAPGFIVDAWEDVADDDRGGAHWSHAVEYKYRLRDGREYTSYTLPRSGRLKDEFRDMVKPKSIEVEFLPNNPSVSRIVGCGCQSVSEWLWRTVFLRGVFLVAFSSPGVIFLRIGLREMKESRTAKGS